MRETDPLCTCGHDINQHGDRAVTPCMGGWQGNTELATIPRCPCQGYTAGKHRRWRRAA